MLTTYRKLFKVIARRDVSRRTSRSASKRRRFCRLGFEVLEDRVVLAVAYTLDTNEVKFTGDKSDDLYVQVAGGVLQWGATNSSLSPVNDGNGTPFQVGADTVISYKLGGSLLESGTLYVLGMDRGGTIQADYDLVIQGDVITVGQDLTLAADHGLTVNAGVTIDATSTTGPAGDITLTATNQTKDPGIGIWNFLQTVIDGVTGSLKQDAAITIGDSAVLKGGDIKATATGGDDVLSAATSIPFAGQFIAQLESFFNDIADLPISVVVKESSATVTVDSGAQILATGDVDLNSSSLSDAAGEATWISLINLKRGGGSSKGGAALGVSYASSDAQTTISSGAVIAAGGDVTVTSTAESDTKMTARVSQNAGLKQNLESNNVQAAMGATVAYLTSKTTVQAGASISAQGTVDIEATGSKSDSLSVYTASFGDGKVGLTAAVSIDKSIVETKVDGAVSAGYAPTPASLIFNPSLAVDFATSSLRFGTAPGYTTGQALIYDSGLGGAIPGLVSGKVYYAIVASDDPESLQLAGTKQDAKDGNYLPFGPAYPTLSTGGLSVPITLLGCGQLDGATSTCAAGNRTILFDYDPGFHENGQVTYAPASGNYLGYNGSSGDLLGALPAGSYTVHIVNGTVTSDQLYSIQLKDSLGNLIDFNDNAILTTAAGQGLQVQGFDTASSTITLVPESLTAAGVTLSNGDALIYTQALNQHVSGLSDGQAYYAIVDPSTPGVIRLGSVPAQARAADPASQLASPTLAWTTTVTTASGTTNTPHTLPIDSVEVSDNPATNQPWNALEFYSDPQLADGTHVTYHAVPGQPIGGLTDGAGYYVYNQINPYFDANDPVYLLALKTTASITADPVTLSLWQTLAVGGGDSYQIVASDAVHNTVSIAASDGSVPTVLTGTALTFTDSFGLSIGGLNSGQTYYAVVAPVQPSPGSLLLALADTFADATDALPTVVSLQATVLLGTLDQSYMSGTQQTLQAAVANSLTIKSTLTSGNTLSSGPEIGSSPSLQQMITQPELAFNSAAWKMWGSDNWPWTSANEDEAGGQAASGWSLASATAYLEVTNTCLVEIGSNAVLKSTGDTQIASTLTVSTQPQVSGLISKATDATKSIAVGVLLAFYDNNTLALVDSNARVDVGGALTLAAETKYPWAWQILNPNPGTTGSLFHDQGDNALGALGTITSGTLGLDTLLCNTWVDMAVQGSKETAADTTLAVSFSWSEFQNTTVAQIADGAQINQDANLQNPNQSVSVTASTDFIQVGFTGLVYLFLTPWSITKLAKDKDSGGSNLVDVSYGKSGSIGGSLGYLSLNNTTQALVGISVPDLATENATATGPMRINFGNHPLAADKSTLPGLNVQATASVTYINISQGGAGSQGVAVTGTLSLPQVATTTTAQIASGAVVTSNAGTRGDVDVTADDTLELIAVAGAVLVSANKEAGVSSSVSTITRNVSAVIGDLPSDVDGAYAYNASGSSEFDVGGAINVSATADGVLVAAAMAAAIVGSTKPDGQDGAGAAAAELPAGSWGWGFSGDFTWVKLTDNVIAAINDGGTFSSAGVVSITSTDTTEVGSGSGAMTIQRESAATSSIGLAGSAAVLSVAGAVQAVLAHAQLAQVAGLAVSAHRDQNLIGVAASGSGSFIGNATEVAGSVTVVQHDGTTAAQVNSATATLSGAVSVTAQDSSELVSVAGSVALGGKSGFGGGAAVTELNGATSAGVTESNITQTAGGMTLSTTQAPSVVAVAAGLAVSRANQGVSVDIAAMVTVNQIQSDTTAAITGGSYTNTSTDSAAGLTVSADDTSEITAVGGEVDFELRGKQKHSSATIGASVAVNTVDGAVGAYVRGADVTLTAGDLALKATCGRDLLAVAVGVGGAMSNGAFGFSVVGSGASNQVTGRTEAIIEGYTPDNGAATPSIVTTDGSSQVTLDAADTSSLEAIAGAASFAVLSSGDFNSSSNATAAFGVSVAMNSIGSQDDAAAVTAKIDGSTVNAAGAVSLTAKASPSIVAGTGAGAGSYTGGDGVTSVGIAGAGAGSGNTSYLDLQAQISGSTVKASSGEVSLDASDESNFLAVAGGILFAGAATEGAAGVAVTVGAALAFNRIDRTTQAIIEGSTVNASGDVDLTATTNATIKAVTVGVAGTANWGESSLGVTVGVFGSGSSNEVNSQTKALIQSGSTVTSDSGQVTLDAQDTSTLTAKAAVVDIAIAATNEAGVSVAVGVSWAINSLGSADDPNAVTAQIDQSTVSAADAVCLTAKASPTIDAGAGAGAGSFDSGTVAAVGIDGAGAGAGNTIYADVQALISSSTVTTNSGSVTLDAEDSPSIKAVAGGVSVAGAVSSEGAGIAITVGAALAFNSMTDDTQAKIQGATINAQGDVDLTATNNGIIQAITVGVAGSLAVGSKAGVAIGGAGSGSGNQIQNTTRAQIEDLTSNGTTTRSVVTSGQDVSLTATENITIVAGAGALGLGIGISGEGVSAAVTVGVSLAKNTITDTVVANINNSTVTAGDSVQLTASIQPASGYAYSIQAVAVAGGTTVGVSEVASVAVPGAGAGVENAIQNKLTASITDCQGTDSLGTPIAVTAQTGDVTLSALDNPSILADGGGATVSVAVGDTAVGVAIGAGIANNSIANQISAYLDSSRVTAAGTVSLSAESTARVTAKPFGVALAVGVSEAGVSAAGSGAAGHNTIANTILAYIQNGSTVTAHGTWADAVTVSATDNSTSTCSGGAGSLAVQIGSGAALAVGAVIAENTITNSVRAYIGCDPSAVQFDAGCCVSSGMDATLVTSDGGVQVVAKSTAEADALAVAVSVSAAIGAEFTTGAGSGSGASATNTIANTIIAAIRNGATVHANGISTKNQDQTEAGCTMLVQASAAPTIKAHVGSGAASVGWFGASVGVSLVDNTVNNTVTAYVDDATVTTNERAIDVTAESTNDIEALAVATSLSVSIGAAGAGGSASSTDKTQTTAYVSAATIQTNFDGVQSTGTYGGLNIGASATGSSISAETDGGSAGIGSVGAFLANAEASGGVTAYLSVNANLQIGDVTVKANGAQDVSTTAIAVIIGELAGSGSSSTTTVADTVKAYLTTSSSSSSSPTFHGSVSITATSEDTGTSEADGGLLGQVGASGNLAHSTVKPTVTAYVGNGVQLDNSASAKDMTISATATNTADSNAYGVLAASLGVGVSEAKPTASATVTAYVGDATLKVGGGLTISAHSTDTATANSQASGGGVLVGDGATADATVTPNVQAYAGSSSGANLTVTGDISLTATETPYADAVAYGVTASIAVAVGIIRSNATISDTGKVRSYLGSGSSLAADSLTITAQQQLQSGQTQTANASSTAGSGGLLTGVVGAYSQAQAGGSVQAYTGNSVTLPDGDITVRAANQTSQSAWADGIGVGAVLGAGKMTAKAGSGVSTSATFGAPPVMNASRTGSLTVQATGSDQNAAWAIAGSGGVVAGDGASATTDNSSTVTAEVSGGTIYAGHVAVLASHTSNYAPGVNSINASAVGASGAEAANTDTASAKVLLDSNTTITAAGLVTIAAQQQITQSVNSNASDLNKGASAYAGAGGVITGDAAGNQATIGGTASKPLTTAAVTLGDSVRIASGTGPFASPGGITIAAVSNLQAGDLVLLSTGGVIAGGGTGSTINAVLANSIAIGTNGSLTSWGNVAVGTSSMIDASTTSQSNVGGLGGTADAHATTNVTSSQTVTVGSGTTVFGFGNVQITAGADPTGLGSAITASSNAAGYAYGLVTIPEATATTSLNSTATLTIDGQIQAGQDVQLGAFTGDLSVLESWNQYWNSANTQSGPSTAVTPVTSSTVTINGTVTAGAYHDLTISIPASQSDPPQVTVTSSGPMRFLYPVPDDLTQSETYAANFASSTYAPMPGYYADFNPTDFIGKYFDPMSAGFLRSGVASGTVPAYVLPALFASGGQVTIDGSSGDASFALKGTGTVTAYAAPTITVNNAGLAYLIVNDILIPDVAAGQILVNESASSGAVGGVMLAPDTTTDLPTVTIDLSYQAAHGTNGPGLFLMGSITNQGGDVLIDNASGSLGQTGDISAAGVTVTVPNGVYGTYIPAGVYGPNTYGDPVSQWADQMIWPGGDPSKTTYTSTDPSPANQAINYVANSVENASQYANNSDYMRHLVGYFSTSSLNNHKCKITNNSCTAPDLSRTASKFGQASRIYVGDNVPFLGQFNGGEDNKSHNDGLGGNSAGLSQGAYKIYTGDGFGETNPFFGDQYDLPDPNNSEGYQDTRGYTPYLDQSLPVSQTIYSYPKRTASAATTAKSLSVTAEWIDMNGLIEVGGSTDSSVELAGADLQQAIQSFQDQFDANQSSGTTLDITSYLGTINSGDKISATYNAQTRQIILGNVSSSNDGKVHLNGKIISTYPPTTSTTGAANIRFQGGLGQIQVRNLLDPITIGGMPYPIPIAVQNVKAAAVAGTLVVVDQNYSPAQQTLYVYEPFNSNGATIKEFVGTAGQTLGTGTPTKTISGTSVNYQPKQNSAWQWAETATLSRTEFGTRNTSSWGLNAWHFNFPDDSPNNPWQSAAPSGCTSVTGCLMTDSSVSSSSSSNPVFKQTINGAVMSEFDYGVFYSRYTITSPDYEFSWTYKYPLSASLTLTNTVRADNPIGIAFAENSQGSLSIMSTGPVILAGEIDLPDSSVSIQAQGNITQASHKTLSAQNLNFTTSGGVGSLLHPLNATLTSGALSVQAGPRGVYLNLNSGAPINSVTAGDASQGFGDVVLSAAGSLTAGTTNVVSGLGGNGTGWTVNGNGITSTPITSDVLTLTDNQNWEARSAWFNTPVRTSSFTASFTYQAGGDNAADGATLTFQNQGLNALGNNGGSLGFAGMAGKTAAYQLNIYDGQTQGTNFVTDGSSGTYNSTGLVNVAGGNPIRVGLAYDAAAGTLNETLTDTVTNATFTRVYTGIDLADQLANQTAFVGFTGGTGGSTSIQTIRDFVFTSPPITNIVGKNITLTSREGFIGASSAPLVIQTHSISLANGGVRDGVVTAEANGDIALTEIASDLLIRKIWSTAGSVFLNVPAGNVYDAATAVSSGSTLDEAQAVWQRLGLTDPAFGQMGVTAFENLVVANYQQYWQLLSNGTVTDGQFTLSTVCNTTTAPSAQCLPGVTVYASQAAAALGVPNPSSGQVQAYAASLYSQVVLFFDDNLPADWMSQTDFQAYNPDFSYTATPEQVDGLTLHTRWTSDQLIYTIDRAALQPAANVPLPDQTPHVAGQAVNIVASGEVGMVRPAKMISLAAIQNSAFTDEEKIALALAHVAGEAMYVGSDGQGNTVTFPDGQTPAGVTVTGVQISIHRPLLVAVNNSPAASLNVTAPNGITVSQTVGDLVVGTIDSDGAVDLAAAGSIVNAQTVISGFGGSGTGWTTNLVGHSATVIASDVLTLTDNNTNQARSAWFNTPVSMDSFQAGFTYQASGNRAADGVTFALQNQGRNALGNTGGSLGFYGITGPTAAHEINIYNGHALGTDFVQSPAVGIAAGRSSATGSFSADTDFSGGTTSSTTAGINTSQVTNPAPQAVYQSHRFGNFTYTIPGLSPGASYNVRLHFAEIYWSAARQREFNVVINGVQVLTNLDVFAQAGGMDIAIAETFTASADATGHVTIQFVTVKDNAMISGIEVTQNPTGAYFSTGSVNVAGGNPIHVALAYDAKAGTLTEVLTDATTNATHTMTYSNVDLASLLGPTAFIGFTGGTGGATATQTIRDFSFVSSSSQLNASDVTLQSLSGGIGRPGDPLRITLGDGQFNASAATGVSVLQTSGNLNVGQVVTDQGDVFLDPPEAGQSVILSNTSRVSAPHGHVMFQADSDVMLAAGSVVEALAVTIQGGLSNSAVFQSDSRITLAGLLNAASILILGGGGNDTVWIGSDGTSPGSLDRILGQIEFRGGGGADALYLDDRAALDAAGQPLRAGYAVTPDQVGNNPGLGFPTRTFAGLTYDASATRLQLLGAAGPGVFHVKPSTNTDYSFDGTSGAGNSLLLDTTGTLGAKLKELLQGGQPVPGAGTWSFAGLHRPIQFTGIDQFHSLTLGAVAGISTLKEATAAGADFAVTYQGLTALDLGGVLGKHDAIRVLGPQGYSQLADFVSVTPSWDGSSQVATYRVPAPGGGWDRTDNGAYTIQILPGQIRDSLGRVIEAAQIGTLWVNVDALWLTGTVEETGQYRLDVAEATPGGVVLLVGGTRAGAYPLDAVGVTLDVADPVYLAEAVADFSGRVQFRVPPALVAGLIGFQALELAPHPQTSRLVYAAPGPRLIASIEPVGAAVVGAPTVQFTVTFQQPVIGVSESDFILAARNVSGARISGLTGHGTAYTITVETGTGDGTLGLDLKDETGIAAATGIASSLTRNGLFAGPVFTIHKTREDVNLDFTVTAQDALILINAINRKGSSFVPADTALEPAWYDVSNDGWVSALDVLLVVNYVNKLTLPTGESEPADVVAVFTDAPHVAGSLRHPLSALEPGSFNGKPNAPAGGGGGASRPWAADTYGLALNELVPPATADPERDLERRPILGETPFLRSPIRRFVPAEAFSSDWDAAGGELDDILTDLGGDAGRS